MSADKVQDALNAVLGNDGGGHDCECATCYHLRVSAHALIAAVREDERERVESRIAGALMTAERGDALLDVVKGAHRAELELAALERDNA